MIALLQAWVLRGPLDRLSSPGMFCYAICVFPGGVSRRVFWMLPVGISRRVVGASWMLPGGLARWVVETSWKLPGGSQVRKLPGGLSSQAELSFRRGLNSSVSLSRGLPPNETVNVLDG
jgi:hypothetical protein